jgi:hypothetical protein
MSDIDIEHDSVLRVLSCLPAHEPGRDRTARVRTRARHLLSSGPSRRRSRSSWGVAWRQALEPTVIGAACAAYLVQIVRLAFRLAG